METVRRMENSIIQMIIKDYNEFFLSNSEISKKYNIHRMNVQKILKDNNVNLRKRTPGIKVDHIFFESYNPYSCYWAGFILADGYVRTEKRNLLSIKLSIKDLSHLEKFKEAIKFEGSIEVNKDFCRISISSKKNLWLESQSYCRLTYIKSSYRCNLIHFYNNIMHYK